MKRANIKYLFIALFFISKSIYAETQKRITIIGNENIDNEIIFSIIDEKITDYSTNNINDIIKTLYSTGNFKNIEIENQDDQIILKIEENPSIDQIEFIGNKRFKDEEILELFDEGKYFKTFNQFTINNFIFDLKNAYASFGYNIVEIEYEVTKKDETDQFVDLTFNINERDISKVNRIYFIGNDIYSDSKLRSIISTKQLNYLRLSRSSNFKIYRIQEDERKLINFYKRLGFKNIDIETQNEFIKKINRFNVYFYINKGKQYYFQEVDFDLNQINIDNTVVEKIINDEVKILSKILKKNNLYNPDIIDKSKNRLAKSLYKNAKFFFKFNVKERIQDNNIDIIIEVSDVEPNYVNNINIYGNTRTKEKVIRREITFVEGDPYNEEELSASKRKIQRLGFFKTVKINDEEINNQIDINITVEEKPTGEFQVGVGIDSYEGTTFITGLKEKNIYGEGRELNINVNTSSQNTTYSFGIVEPYIFNRDIDFIFDIEYAFRDRSESLSYDLEEFNTDVGFKYALADKISHSIILKYVLKEYEISSSSASNSIQKLGGSNADLLLDNKINYYDLDSFYRPSKGTTLSYLNIISPTTNNDNGYIKNLITYSKYYPYKRKNIISFKSTIGNVFSLQNTELSVDDKFSLGGRWLRGFDRFGVGPRESTSSYIGGKNIIAAKFDFNRPILGTSDNPIDLNLFTDIGTVFDNKVDPTYSKDSIRASYGFGIKFYSLIGPIGFSWGFPLLKEDHDIERMFAFNIGLLN